MRKDQMTKREITLITLAIGIIYYRDKRPVEHLIQKIVDITQLKRERVHQFLKNMRSGISDIPPSSDI
jgi:hypothetical protein